VCGGLPDSDPDRDPPGTALCGAGGSLLSSWRGMVVGRRWWVSAGARLAGREEVLTVERVGQRVCLLLAWSVPVNRSVC
jgi:hypothetical protein